MESETLRIALLRIELCAERRGERIRISLFAENAANSFESIYESDWLSPNGRARSAALNEIVAIRLDDRQRLFKIGAELSAERFERYFFVDDIARANGRLKLGEKRVFVHFALPQSLPTHFVRAPKQCATEEKVELGALVSTAIEFFAHVTALRRLVADVEERAARSAPIADARALLFALLFLWRPFASALAALGFAAALGARRSYRFALLGAAARYFEENEKKSVRDNLNLRFLVRKQKQIIEICAAIRRVLYRRDRADFYKVFVRRAHLKIGAAIICLLFPFKAIVAISLIAIFTFKYFRKSADFVALLGELPRFPFGAESLFVRFRGAFSRNPKVHFKESFLLQTQRWSFGFWDAKSQRFELPSAEGGAAVERESVAPGDGWRWVDAWRPLVHGETDGEGWTYAPSLGAEFRAAAAGTDRVRRRIWVRKCEKVFCEV